MDSKLDIFMFNILQEVNVMTDVKKQEENLVENILKIAAQFAVSLDGFHKAAIKIK